ncbi:hypothetical protein ACQP2F_16475 [Actinoplanes sp. CA-030573]|uniref:hypothetical protein n=1 Tax=Actinoplanes sp. CA-030573 TaxID=3239898 RepID=UPI003D8A19D6
MRAAAAAVAWRVAGIDLHLLLIEAAVAAVVLLTSHLAYPPTVRAALVALVVVLCLVTVAGRLPLGLGPASPSVAAALVRTVGVALAGAGVVVVVLDLTQTDTPARRTADGAPLAAVVLSLYLAAFLALTSRDGGLPPRAMLTGAGLGLLPALLFAAAVPVLWPALVWWWGFLLIAGAAAGSGLLVRSGEIGLRAALLATITACQAVFFTAAVLYHDGPDAWMPYAGPGPLTLQGQLEQNRAEAIDPYVGLLFLGAVAATGLTVQALTTWRRSLGSAAITA